MIRGYKIYRIINDVDDMVYIGSTRTRLLSNRMTGHRANARDEDCKKKIAVHMRTIGIPHFKIELIREVDIPDSKIGKIQELIEYWKIPIEKRLNSVRPFTHNSEKTRCIIKRRATRRAFYNRHKQDPAWLEKERERNKLRMREKRRKMKLARNRVTD